MGWINRKSRAVSAAMHARNVVPPEPQKRSDLKDEVAEASFVEDIATLRLNTPTPNPTSDTTSLPFISPQRVSAARDSRLLWIVIDNIVYDCTEFASAHPGGADVIESFSGSDCSWQFWRFHAGDEMREFGEPLRIGYTKGVANKFKERPRFVGLRTIWDE